jgi:uncharacterized ParB-like nuclease family protein
VEKKRPFYLAVYFVSKQAIDVSLSGHSGMCLFTPNGMPTLQTKDFLKDSATLTLPLPLAYVVRCAQFSSKKFHSRVFEVFHESLYPFGAAVSQFWLFSANSFDSPTTLATGSDEYNSISISMLRPPLPFRNEFDRTKACQCGWGKRQPNPCSIGPASHGRLQKNAPPVAVIRQLFKAYAQDGHGCDLLRACHDGWKNDPENLRL